MIYVVSDLHGYPIEKFLDMLKQIEFSKYDFLYVLGDVIDRGKDGIKLLKWMMLQPNVELILGNHEAMMLSCDFLFEEITDSSIDRLTGTKLNMFSVWANNGGLVTIDVLKGIRDREIKYILEYLREAPLWSSINVNGTDYLLTHSGLGDFEKEKPITEYTAHQLIWTRPTLETEYYDDAIVVFGHTPTFHYGEEYKGKMLKTKTWIDIDVGAGVGLTPMILRLDDMKEFYF